MVWAAMKAVTETAMVAAMEVVLVAVTAQTPAAAMEAAVAVATAVTNLPRREGIDTDVTVVADLKGFSLSRSCGVVNHLYRAFFIDGVRPLKNSKIVLSLRGFG
jgi:hypothetical protein